MIDLLFFADSLKRHRKAAGLTQTELARRLDVTPQSVSRWERGETIPDIEHLAESVDPFAAVNRNHPKER